MTTVKVPAWRPLAPRDPHEPGRAATPLELLFDLVFVVAIASNAAQLHHAIVEEHPLEGIIGYSMAWFAIWWAWMGFTWFASAYDNDDALYRLLAFVIMAGTLLLAAAIPDLFADGQSVLAVIGYAVMRVGMIALWLRAAQGDRARRGLAVRYAGGIALAQALWILRLWAPETWLVPTFFVLVALELSVPFWAEGRSGTSPWHRHHIAQRFSLMAIIVMGEVLLSSVMAVQGTTQWGLSLVPLVLGGLMIVFGLWWIYFKLNHHELTDGGLITWLFAYGHLVIFASVASIGAGLAAAVDAVSGEADPAVGRLAVWVMAAGIALATLPLAGLHAGHRRSPATMAPAVVLAVGVLVVAALPLPTPWAVLGLGAVVAGVVTHHVIRSTVTS